MSPEQAIAQEMQRAYEEEREFQLERRRMLIAEVGLIERRYGVAPVCRTCAGCSRCETLHRGQDVVSYSRKARDPLGPRPSSN
jgi:hypothetical protein